MLSPTDFQNSVYNTAVSYASILFENKNEILTISSGDETSFKVLKAGAIKALDNDEVVLICSETINIPNIQEVNSCIDFLESVVALKVKMGDTTEHDIKQLCLNSDITIEDDLVKHFFHKYGNFRPVKVLLNALEEYCENNDIKNASLTTFKTSAVERINEK
jgi:hypothetical protein